MLLRRGARLGMLPMWKLRKWLPGVLAAGLGIGVAGWADVQAPAPPSPMKKSGTDAPAPAPEKTHTLYFAKANWPEVLDWFAKESGLTPILTIQPTGSVDIKPPMGKKFTMGEVVDLLNEAMAQQKFILIRRQVTFYIHPSDEKINATDVPRLELSELPTRGKTELVQVLIPLKSLTAQARCPKSRNFYRHSERSPRCPRSTHWLSWIRPRM